MSQVFQDMVFKELSEALYEFIVKSKPATLEDVRAAVQEFVCGKVEVKGTEDPNKVMVTITPPHHLIVELGL